MYDELTPTDIKKMEDEIEYRKLVVRPKALEDVKEARAHGDLSENFEYYAAKKYKNQNESRIRYLERMIKTAKVISENSAVDEVGINNTVTVEFIDDGTEEDYKIVTTVRGNSLEGLISNESPLGKALLGKKVGDVVHVQVNANVGYDVEIKALKTLRMTGTRSAASNALRTPQAIERKGNYSEPHNNYRIFLRIPVFNEYFAIVTGLGTDTKKEL